MLVVLLNEREILVRQLLLVHVVQIVFKTYHVSVSNFFDNGVLISNQHEG